MNQIPLTRRDKLRENTREEIKAIARQDMAKQGTAGLSLRAIASAMGMSAPALYRYYVNRDDLITALIVDAFNSLAAALQDAFAGCEAQGSADCLIKLMTTYREWVLANPIEFQLIYGNPIPDYHAPAEITVPASRGCWIPIVSAFNAALESRTLVPPFTLEQLPEATYRHITELTKEYPVSPLSMYLAVTAWGQGHGLIMLELFGHLGPTIGDTTVFYQHQIEQLLRQFGWQH